MPGKGRKSFANKRPKKAENVIIKKNISPLFKSGAGFPEARKLRESTGNKKPTGQLNPMASATIIVEPMAYLKTLRFLLSINTPTISFYLIYESQPLIRIRHAPIVLSNPLSPVYTTTST